MAAGSLIREHCDATHVLTCMRNKSNLALYSFTARQHVREPLHSILAYQVRRVHGAASKCVNANCVFHSPRLDVSVGGAQPSAVVCRSIGTWFQMSRVVGNPRHTQVGPLPPSESSKPAPPEACKTRIQWNEVAMQNKSMHSTPYATRVEHDMLPSMPGELAVQRTLISRD
eukprot:364612-Chlamydomonas_euryale.AAC.15